MYQFVKFLLKKLRVIVCLRALAVIFTKICKLLDYLLRRNVKSVMCNYLFLLFAISFDDLLHSIII